MEGPVLDTSDLAFYLLDQENLRSAYVELVCTRQAIREASDAISQSREVLADSRAALRHAARAHWSRSADAVTDGRAVAPPAEVPKGDLTGAFIRKNRRRCLVHAIDSRPPDPTGE
jgi:hypothetical protein